MKLNLKITLTSMVIALSILGLSACNDGSAENAGEKIDEVMTDTQNKIEDACEQVKSDLELKDKDCE